MQNGEVEGEDGDEANECVVDTRGSCVRDIGQEMRNSQKVARLCKAGKNVGPCTRHEGIQEKQRYSSTHS